jgi:hypothetical protein
MFQLVLIILDNDCATVVRYLKDAFELAGHLSDLAIAHGKRAESIGYKYHSFARRTTVSCVVIGILQSLVFSLHIIIA